jgi:hypothetical protein
MKRQNFRVRKPLKVERVRAIVTGKHTLLAPRNLTKNSVLRKSKFPIRITKRNVKGTHFLFPGDWVVCDLYLSPATPAWFSIIRYSIKEFNEYEESFENREFIDECTSIIGELDENLNMYYVSREGWIFLYRVFQKTAIWSFFGSKKFFSKNFLEYFIVFRSIYCSDYSRN